MTTQDTSKHQCHCGRSFIRKEHLTRHQATHGRPSHVCRVCQRSFTRSDLLRRHATIHDAPATGEPQRPKACDYCHYGKVRCDGGARCTNCEKRGITCTYTRGEGQGPGPGPELPLNPIVSGGLETTEAVVVSSDEEGMDYSMPNPEEYDRPRLDNDAELGLSTLLGLCKHNPSLPMHNDLPAKLKTFETWWVACHKKYLDRFHDHWPVFHDPSWEGMGYTVRTGAFVAMIASWSGDERDAQLDGLVLRTHAYLMETLAQELMNPPEDSDAAWPSESWSLTLCNVVFALNSGRRSLILPAQRLFAMLVEDCRCKRVFSADAIKRQTERHHPGTFQPWVYVHCEQFNRLVTSMFKLDTYLSLLYGRPPQIRRDELNVGLPTPLTLWNAHGLDVYFKRLPHEPEDRKVYRIPIFLRCAYRSLTPTMLFEDVQLLLCGVAQRSWQMSRVRAEDAEIKSPEDKTRAADALNRLRVLRIDLDRLDRIVREPHSDPEGHEYLLWSYTTAEELQDPDWKKSVLERIRSLRFCARMLFHMINMRIYANVDLLWQTESGGNGDGGHDKLAAWAHSEDGRRALLHALQVLSLAQEEPKRLTLPCEPVSKMTLATAALVLHAWFSKMRTGQDANALPTPEGPRVDISLKSLSTSGTPENRQAQEWLAEGRGSTLFSGMPLTGRMAQTWLARTWASLEPVRPVWPLCEKVAMMFGK